MAGPPRQFPQEELPGGYGPLRWSLFGRRHGNGGSAGKLIADAHAQDLWGGGVEVTGMVTQ